MKRRLLFSALFLFLFALVGCGGKVTFAPYTIYVDDGIVEYDDFVTMDGILDEPFWEEVKQFAYVINSKVNSEYTMESRCYLTEKGVYFGIIVTDPAVYYNFGRSAAKNTSSEVYLARFDETERFVNLVR